MGAARSPRLTAAAVMRAFVVVLARIRCPTPFSYSAITVRGTFAPRSDFLPHPTLTHPLCRPCYTEAAATLDFLTSMGADIEGGSSGGGAAAAAPAPLDAPAASSAADGAAAAEDGAPPAKQQQPQPQPLQLPPRWTVVAGGACAVLIALTDPGVFRALDERVVKRLGGDSGAALEVLSLFVSSVAVGAASSSSSSSSAAAAAASGAGGGGGARLSSAPCGRDGSRVLDDGDDGGWGGTEGRCPSSQELEGRSGGGPSPADVALRRRGGVDDIDPVPGSGGGGGAYSSAVALEASARKQQQAAAQAAPASARGTGMLVSRVTPPGSRMSCAACSVTFDGADSHRAHFRSDVHRYNLKLKMRGQVGISEETFALLTNAERSTVLEALE